MKKLIVAIILLSAVACSSSKKETSNGKDTLDTTKLATGSEFYQCPMHPEVLSGKPGNCPKCGMPLEKIFKK